MALSLDGGHSWYDDFAQYVMQAANTARLAPFAETLYAYHADAAGVGPKLYPPVFPALLAFAYRMFGVDLFVFKLVCVACSTAALCVTLALFHRRLAPGARFHYIFILGFSPALWELREYIYSEHLFILLFYAALFVMDKWYVRGAAYFGPIAHGFLLGGLVYLCYGTRVIGVVLFPTIVCCELLAMWSQREMGHRVRLSTVGVVALFVGAGLAALQSLFMPSSINGYLVLMNGLTVNGFIENLLANAKAFSFLWENGALESVRRVGGAIFALIAAIGFITSNFPRPTPLGIATVGYFCAVALWPEVAWLRVIWPLLPAFVFYLLVGAHDLSSWKPALRSAPSLAILVFTVVSYGTYYSRVDFNPSPDGVDSRSAKELYAFLVGDTAKEEGILFWKPRGLALFTGRRVGKFPTRSPESVVLRARELGATVLVVRSDGNASETRVASRIAGLRETFRNEAYVAYRLNP